VRSDTEVCPIRLQQAQKAVAVATATDTEQVVVVYLRPFFAGGIETQEQLDAALAGVRDKLESLIGAGKKIVLG
jgi:exonuclease VII small subunit